MRCGISMNAQNPVTSCSSISVATARGNFVLDTMKLPTLTPFLEMLEDPKILKITHAGENDYQILAIEYGVSPVNLFDTQLAYGFMNRDYPLGLQFLVERELKLQMNKGALKSDWEKRPLSPEQLQYAVSDVLHLYPLFKTMKRKLNRRGKLDWACEENLRWEAPGYFSSEPLDLVEYIAGMSTRNLNRQQTVFLMRLHQWRHSEAKRRNCPLNQVLKTRLINTIVRGISGGKSMLQKDRTVPENILNQHWALFKRLYNRRITPKERSILNQLPKEENGDPHLSVLMDILYQVIRMKAVEHGISPNLILSRKERSKMKTDNHFCPDSLRSGWRKQVLGNDLLEWIKKRNPIDIVFENNACKITMRSWDDESDQKPTRLKGLSQLMSPIRDLFSNVPRLRRKKRSMEGF